MDDQTDVCRVWWDEELGLARARWRKGGVCTGELARTLDARVAALGHGRVPTLVDTRAMASIDRDARQFFMTSQSNYASVALLADSPATRMMANFFLRMNRGGNPVKMFTDEAEAVVWLHAHR